MPRKHDYLGGVIGADPLVSSTPRTSGVFNLGALGGDGAASGDANWDDVTLLLDGSGGGSATITDHSTTNNTVTNVSSGVGSATATTPYASSISVLDFNAAQNDELEFDVSTAMQLSGDFTIETWIKRDSIARQAVVNYWGTSSDARFNFEFDRTSGSVTFTYDTGPSSNYNLDFSYSGTSAAGTTNWFHLAVTRSGTDLKCFIDGTQIGTTQTISTTTFVGNSTYSNKAYIGSLAGVQNYFDGQMADFRITKGTARDIAADWTAGVYNSPMPQVAPVAGATRPTRRWGGMTGRSLVETTTGAAPQWTPDDVTNTAAPAIWLDASTGLTTNKGSLSTTVTLGTGAWSSSGTQNGLTTAINSAAGTVVPISFTGTAVASIAMLYKWDSAGASRSYGTTFSGSTNNDYVFMGGNGSAVLHSYGNADSHNWDHVREDGVEYSTSHTTAAAWGTRTTNWMLHVFVLNSTRTATINRWGFERIYANRHFTGEIAEVMAFPGKLSQSECEQVEGYLAHKWGLASLLPSAHSYKAAAPTSGTGTSFSNVPTTGVLSLAEDYQTKI